MGPQLRAPGGAPLLAIAGDHIVVPSEDGTQAYVFTGSGRHVRTLDALTAAVLYEFSHDSSGRLTSITDCDGNVTTIQRDGSGNPAAIIAPLGQRTALCPDAKGYLAQIENPAGEAFSFTYSVEGLMKSLTTPRGDAHTFAYAQDGRPTKDSDPLGGFKSLVAEWEGSDFNAWVTTALNRTTTYITRQIPGGGEQRFTIAPDGTESASVLNRDDSKTFTTGDGTMTKLTPAPDPRFGMSAPYAKSTTVKTPSGRTLSASADRTATLDADGNVTAFTKKHTVNDRLSSSAYDAATSRVISTSPQGRQVVEILGDRGRIAERRVTGLEPVGFTYDARGRLESATQGGRAMSLAYDGEGNLASITDPLGRTTSFAYDLAGRVLSQTFPDGREVLFGYDPNGNLTSLTPPGRPAHTFTYNPVNLRLDYVPPAVGAGSTTTRNAYNLDKQLTSVTRPDGSSIGHGYDSAGRLSTVGLRCGQYTYAYAQGTGQLSQITSPGAGTLSFTYDGFLPTGTTWAGAIAGSVGSPTTTTSGSPRRP